MLERSPIVATIDLDALASNLALVRARVDDVPVMGVIKADAYGHGAVPVALRLEQERIDCLGVARIEEGIELREGGVTVPIYILSGVWEDRAADLVQHRLTPVLFDLDVARQIDASLAEMDATLDVHLKVDTGMGRIGIAPADLPDALLVFAGLSRVNLAGVLSHLSESDADETAFTEQQMSDFAVIVETSGNILAHLANSGAVIQHPRARYGLVRPGILLFGAMPDPAAPRIEGLTPVMELSTRVIQVKTVPAGTPVSYGRTYVTDREQTLATVAVGYGDGYSRALSNRAEVLVRGRRAPVRGRVCMDLTLVDVTGIPGVSPGDHAILLGSGGEERITAEELASKAGTIPYEIFTAVSKRVPRVYKGVGAPGGRA